MNSLTTRFAHLRSTYGRSVCASRVCRRGCGGTGRCLADRIERMLPPNRARSLSNSKHAHESKEVEITARRFSGAEECVHVWHDPTSGRRSRSGGRSRSGAQRVVQYHVNRSSLRRATRSEYRCSYSHRVPHRRTRRDTRAPRLVGVGRRLRARARGSPLDDRRPPRGPKRAQDSKLTTFKY